MRQFLLGRVVSAIPTLLIVTIAVFVMVRLIPGDPAKLMPGDLARPEQVEDLRRHMGLDRPIFVQYFVWLGNILTGDFGRSITTAQDVLPFLLERFLVSATIVLVAVSIAAVIAVPAGMFAAWRQNSLADLGVVALSTLLLSIPSFWLGLMILLFLGLQLNWLPIVGCVSFDENFTQALSFIAMPVLTLVLVEIGEAQSKATHCAERARRRSSSTRRRMPGSSGASESSRSA